MKRILKPIILAIVAIAVAFVVYKLFFQPQEAKTRATPPVIIQVAQSKTANWQLEIEATGTLEAFQGIMVKPEVSGRVTQIFMKSGEDIQQGQPILEIFPDEIKAQLAQDQANFELTRVDYARQKSLYEKRVASKQAFDTATANLKAAQAQVDNDKAKLSLHTIKAAFSGRLGLKQVDLGDYLKIGDSIVNLQALTPIKVTFSVPETYLDDLALGQVATLTNAAYPKQKFTGKVIAFDSAVNINTRSLGVWAELPNKDKKLLPGMFAEVTLSAGKPRDVVIVPAEAVSYSPSGNYVYLVKNNQAIKQIITVGERRGSSVSIEKGLKPGETVITAGQIKISNGSPVIVEGSKAEAEFFKKVKALQAKKK